MEPWRPGLASGTVASSLPTGLFSPSAKSMQADARASLGCVLRCLTSEATGNVLQVNHWNPSFCESCTSDLSERSNCGTNRSRVVDSFRQVSAGCCDWRTFVGPAAFSQAFLFLRRQRNATLINCVPGLPGIAGTHATSLAGAFLGRTERSTPSPATPISPFGSSLTSAPSKCFPATAHRPPRQVLRRAPNRSQQVQEVGAGMVMAMRIVVEHGRECQPLSCHRTISGKMGSLARTGQCTRFLATLPQFCALLCPTMVGMPEEARRLWSWWEEPRLRDIVGKMRSRMPLQREKVPLGLTTNGRVELLALTVHCIACHKILSSYCVSMAEVAP